MGKYGKKIIVYDNGNIARLSEFIYSDSIDLRLEVWGDTTGRVKITIKNEDYDKILNFFRSLIELKDNQKQVEQEEIDLL